MFRILSVLCMLCLMMTGCSDKEAASIGIIGGADGPTAIFVSSGVSIAGLLLAVILLFVIGAILGYLLYKKRKK